MRHMKYPSSNQSRNLLIFSQDSAHNTKKYLGLKTATNRFDDPFKFGIATQAVHYLQLL